MSVRARISRSLLLIGFATVFLCTPYLCAFAAPGKPAPSVAKSANCVPNRFGVGTVDPVHVVLNGISYAIPRAYFPGFPPPGCGAEELSFLIRAFLPDFSGSTAETVREFNQGSERTVQISLHSVRQTSVLEDFLRIWTDQNGNNPPRYPITWDGVETYGLLHGSYRVIYGPDPSSGRNVDVYVERQNDRVLNVIKCQTFICTNMLFFGNAQLQIDFEPKHLADWRAIQGGVVHLLDRFALEGVSLSANASAYSAETVNCVPYKPPPGTGYVPPPASAATEPVRVAINGIGYAIPHNYFSDPKRCGEQMQRVRLRAFLPDFAGATTETLGEFEQTEPSSRTVGILLRSDRLAPDSEGILEGWRLRSKDGIPRYLITWDGTETYGLQHGVYHWIQERDVYVERRNDRIVNLIQCTSPNVSLNPSCTSYVFFGNAQLQIDFDRERLADWRAIRAGVVNLLDRLLREGARPKNAAR